MFSRRSLLPSGVLPGNAATLPVYKGLAQDCGNPQKIWTLVKYFKTVMIVELGIDLTRVVMETMTNNGYVVRFTDICGLDQYHIG